MTFEEVRNGRILDPEEGSALFEGIGLEDGDIKKLKRKVSCSETEMKQVVDMSL